MPIDKLLEITAFSKILIEMNGLSLISSGSVVITWFDYMTSRYPHAVATISGNVTALC